MHTRRLAVMVTISVILAACSTAARPAVPDNEQAGPSGQSTVPTTGVSEVEFGSDADATQESVATQADSEADSEADLGDDPTTPAPTTDTPKAEVTQSTTTTEGVASTEGITSLLAELDSLLSSLGDQIEGLDKDLADVDASLKADEGDIEE